MPPRASRARAFLRLKDFRAHSRGRGRFHVFCIWGTPKKPRSQKRREVFREDTVSSGPLQPNPHVPAGTGPLRPVALRRGSGYS